MAVVDKPIGSFAIRQAEGRPPGVEKTLRDQAEFALSLLCEARRNDGMRTRQIGL